jgi:hypothetical protein
MKATIKIVSAGKFTNEQEQIIKRVAMVLIEHNLSVKVINRIKVEQKLKLKKYEKKSKLCRYC